MAKPKFMVVYYNMRRRCNTPHDPSYKDYGGRGIKCLWKKYEDFENDMFDSYYDAIYDGIKNPTLDRIDNNGNYYKDNCRWVTMKVQSNNRRNNNRLSIEEKRRLIRIDRLKKNKYGVTLGAYLMRKHKGWSEKEAQETPMIKRPLKYIN